MPPYKSSSSSSSAPRHSRSKSGKYDAEVYALNSRHEHRTHILQVRAVIRHAVVFDAEAARARRTEGRAQAVEQGHAARQQKQYAQDGEYDVYLIQQGWPSGACGAPFYPRWAGAFGPQQMDAVTRSLSRGHHGQQEYQHAHTAQPVCKAAPVQQPVAHGLHVCQNRRACGGKTGHRLKKRVYIMRYLARDVKRQRAHGREQDPAQGHDDEALFGVKLPRGLRTHAVQRAGQRQQQRHRPQKAPQGCARLAVNKAHGNGWQHEKRLQEKEHANQLADHFLVHSFLRECRPSVGKNVIQVVDGLAARRDDDDGVPGLEHVAAPRDDGASLVGDAGDQYLGLKLNVQKCLAQVARGLGCAEFQRLCLALHHAVQRNNAAAVVFCMART